MRVVTAIISGIVASAFALPVDAAVSRPRIYPASWCKYRASQHNDTWLSTSSTNATGIRNTDTSAHTISCPMPRSYKPSSTTGGVYAAVVSMTGLSWSVSDVNIYITRFDGNTSWVVPTSSKSLSEYPEYDVSQVYFTSFATEQYASTVMTINLKAGERALRYAVLEATF